MRSSLTMPEKRGRWNKGGRGSPFARGPWRLDRGAGWTGLPIAWRWKHAGTGGPLRGRCPIVSCTWSRVRGSDARQPAMRRAAADHRGGGGRGAEVRGQARARISAAGGAAQRFFSPGAVSRYTAALGSPGAGGSSLRDIALGAGDSCTRAGGSCPFSWRLVLAPPMVPGLSRRRHEVGAIWRKNEYIRRGTGRFCAGCVRTPDGWGKHGSKRHGSALHRYGLNIIFADPARAMGGPPRDGREAFGAAEAWSASAPRSSNAGPRYLIDGGIDAAHQPAISEGRNPPGRRRRAFRKQGCSCGVVIRVTDH